MRVAVAVQLIMYAWMTYFWCVCAAMGSVYELRKRYQQPYLFYNKSIAQFQVLKSHTNGLAPSIQRIDLSEDLTSIVAQESAIVGLEKQSMDVDSACWYFVGFMVTYLHNSVKNVHFYSLAEDALFVWD